MWAIYTPRKLKNPFWKTNIVQVLTEKVFLKVLLLLCRYQAFEGCWKAWMHFKEEWSIGRRDVKAWASCSVWMSLATKFSSSITPPALLAFGAHVASRNPPEQYKHKTSESHIQQHCRSNDWSNWRNRKGEGFLGPGTHGSIRLRRLSV